MRVGGASVNHLHFQGLYFNSTPDGLMAIESAKTVPLVRNESLMISELEEYPIPALVYSRGLLVKDNKEAIPQSVKLVIDKLHECMFFLLKNNIPHNLIISARAARYVPKPYIP